MPVKPTPWLLLLGYGLTLVIAATTVPSWEAFWFYGLPTWFGGLFFALLVPWWLSLIRRA